VGRATDKNLPQVSALLTTRVRTTVFASLAKKILPRPSGDHAVFSKIAEPQGDQASEMHSGEDTVIPRTAPRRSEQQEFSGEAGDLLLDG